MNTLRTYFLIAIFGTLGSAASGQEDSVLITKNFKFRDGVYLTLAQWQANRPAYSWEEVDALLATNPQTFLTQVEKIRVRASGERINPDSLWGICLAGIPYVRIPKEEANKEVPTFAGLRVRGKICYFSYPSEVKRQVKVTAYNPLTKRPFRSGYVDRSETVDQEQMLDFTTGEVAPFEVGAFLEWITDDAQLVETVLALPDEEQKEKLFKCLLIYVDRHPVYVISD